MKDRRKVLVVLILRKSPELRFEVSLKDLHSIEVQLVLDKNYRFFNTDEKQ